MSRGGERQAPATTVASAVPAESVEEWARGAKAGDVLVYFTGSYLLQSLPAVAAVRRLQEQGLVTLYQRRVGPARFDYCVQRRNKVERGPLSRAAVDTSGMAPDTRDLFRELQRLAAEQRECPSNSRLADLAGLKDNESARYRLGWLVQAGHIEIATPPDGSARIITILATGARTASGAAPSMPRPSTPTGARS